MRPTNLLTGVSACALAFAFTAASNAQEALPSIDVGAAMPAPAAAPIVPPASSPPTAAPPAKPFTELRVPESVSHVAVVASQTKEEIDQTVNVMTTAETFKYLPSVLVRERFIGDRNATIEGRVTIRKIAREQYFTRMACCFRITSATATPIRRAGA